MDLRRYIAVMAVETVDGKVTETHIAEHVVQQGDIWRACVTKDAAIRDWVRLAGGSYQNKHGNRPRMCPYKQLSW